MDSDKPGEHDRAVVRALRSLGPPTAPTAAERARMRVRLLDALDAEAASGGLTAAPPGVGDLGGGPEITTESALAGGTAADSAAETEPTLAAETDAPREAGPETASAPGTAGGMPGGADARAAADAESGADAPADSRTGAGTEDETDAGAGLAGRTRSGRRARSEAKRAAAAKAGSSRVGRRALPASGSAGSRPGAPSGTARPPGASTGTPSGSREDTRRSVMAGVRGRFAVAAVAVLALVGSLAGMSLLLARDALPGDALYGVKRTAEAASLGLTFGEEPKALKHLEFAAARIGEIETLARRYPNPSDAPVGGYLTALTDFDNDAAAGSRQLVALATSTDGQLLESLRDWATQQAGRLNRVAARLPEAARNRQIASLALLDKITTRSVALLRRMDCYQITSGSYDDIGATPATGVCEQGPGVDPGLSSSTSPSVPATPDKSTAPDGSTRANVPLAPVEPTPEVPPVPVPGVTASVPAPLPRPSGGEQEPPTQEQPPLLGVPSLLPELPEIGIG